METRTFYKPAMKSGNGKQLQIYIPKRIAEGLDIHDREELEIVIKKTGHIVKKRENLSEPFRGKDIEESNQLE